MSDLEGAPNAYRHLAKELVSAGFASHYGDPDSATFGDQVALFESGTLAVRIVQDRGQWFVEIAAPKSEAWFSPVIWMAYLSKELPDPRSLSPDEEVSFICSDLDSFNFTDDPDSTSQLEAWRERRASQRRNS